MPQAFVREVDTSFPSSWLFGSQFSMSAEALLAHGDHCESPIAQN